MSIRRTKKRKKDNIQKNIIGIQQQDIILKQFFQENERFADLFNAVFFRGEERIKAEKLEEMDTELSHILSSKHFDIVLKNTRDIAKKMVDGVILVILGTEIQSHIDYGMPVRAMGYDYSTYAKNIRELKRTHRKSKIKLDRHEFLSGIQKTDLLPPVMTIVLYTGREPWDGPLSLHEMLVPIPEYMKPFIADYKINLLQVQNSEQFHFKNTDVSILFDVTRMVFQKQYDRIYEKYQDKPISKEVVTAIGSITKFPQLVELEENQKGEIIMCNFMEEYREYCFAQGIEKGIEKGMEKGIAQGMLNAAELLVGQGKAVEEIAIWLNLPRENIEQYLASKH